MKQINLKNNEYDLLGHIIALKIDDINDEIDSILNDKNYNGFPDKYLIDKMEMYNQLLSIYINHFE